VGSSLNIDRNRRLAAALGLALSAERRSDRSFRREFIASCLVGCAQGSFVHFSDRNLEDHRELPCWLRPRQLRWLLSDRDLEDHRELPCWLRPRQLRGSFRIETWKIIASCLVGCAQGSFVHFSDRDPEDHRELPCWLRPRQLRALFGSRPGGACVREADGTGAGFALGFRPCPFSGSRPGRSYIAVARIGFIATRHAAGAPRRFAYPAAECPLDSSRCCLRYGQPRNSPTLHASQTRPARELELPPTSTRSALRSAIPQPTVLAFTARLSFHELRHSSGV